MIFHKIYQRSSICYVQTDRRSGPRKWRNSARCLCKLSKLLLFLQTSAIYM